MLWLIISPKYFKTGTPDDINGGWLEYPLYWGPMGFVICTVVICVVLVLIPSIQVSEKKSVCVF